NCDRRWMPNHDRFECQTAIDSDAILQDRNKSWLFCFFRRINSSTILRGAELPLSNTVPPEKTDGTQRKILQT
ncbi:hypothetical protein BEA19_29810, partial [Escherichia coli]